jgi:hypothetical protein
MLECEGLQMEGGSNGAQLKEVTVFWRCPWIEVPLYILLLHAHMLHWYVCGEFYRSNCTKYIIMLQCWLHPHCYVGAVGSDLSNYNDLISKTLVYPANLCDFPPLTVHRHTSLIFLHRLYTETHPWFSSIDYTQTHIPDFPPSTVHRHTSLIFLHRLYTETHPWFSSIDCTQTHIPDYTSLIFLHRLYTETHPWFSSIDYTQTHIPDFPPLSVYRHTSLIYLMLYLMANAVMIT